MTDIDNQYYDGRGEVEYEDDQVEETQAEENVEEEAGVESEEEIEETEETQTEEAESEEGENKEPEEDENASDKRAYEVLKKYAGEDDGIQEKGSYEKLLENYSTLQDKVQRYDEDSKAIADLLEQDPLFADVMEATLDGVPFSVALATYMDLENVKPMKGEADYDQYVQAKEKRKQELEQKHIAEQEFQQNQKETEKVSQEFFSEQNMDDSQQKGLADFVDGIIKDLVEGKITKDTLTRLHKAWTYDTDIEKAREAGEINGRNQRIEQQRESRRKGSDGLPSAGSPVERAEKTSKSGKLLDWLDDSNDYYNS